MDDLVKSLVTNVKESGSDIQELLKDKRTQEIVAIAGTVYLLSKQNKERNAIVAGLVSVALLPDGKAVKKAAK